MNVGIATAISARWESQFVQELATTDGGDIIRRCADTAELLTVIEAGQASVAAVSADFPGVDGQLIAELTMRGARVLGVAGPHALVDARAFESWGVGHVHVLGSGTLDDTLHELVFQGAVPEAHADGERSRPLAAHPSTPPEGIARGVIAVWGPPGAPGRTTTACHIADALKSDSPVLLIDADTTAPSVAGMVGLLDEAPGTLAAARLIDAGTFNAAQLQRLVANVSDGFDVLTGIGRADRWAEFGAHHLRGILAWAQSVYRWIVIDIASDLSTDEALVYDTVAPVRNAASVTALEECSDVIVVTGADPISLQRLVSSWNDLDGFAATRHVVVTKARSAAVGGKPDILVRRALERFAGIEVSVVIPDARDELDTALLEGKLVSDTAPQSPFIASFNSLSAALGANTETASASRGFRLRRRR